MKGAGGVPVVAAPGGGCLSVLKLDISLKVLNGPGLLVDNNLLLFYNLDNDIVTTSIISLLPCSGDPVFSGDFPSLFEY